MEVAYKYINRFYNFALLACRKNSMFKLQNMIL